MASRVLAFNESNMFVTQFLRYYRYSSVCCLNRRASGGTSNKINKQLLPTIYALLHLKPRRRWRATYLVPAFHFSCPNTYTTV